MSLPSRSRSLLLLVALLGAAGVAVAAPQQHPQRGRAAPPESGRTDAQRAPQQRPERPDWARPAPRRNEDALSDSVRRVEQRTRGQVLSAERVPYDGRNLNRIKVVDERGRVRVYMDDPQQPPRQGGGDDAPTRDNDD
jgi:hypothetical protein